MKAAQLISYGGDETISINIVPIPEVQAGKVVVEVHDAGVNPFDWHLRAGFMKEKISLALPVTLGGDFSGVVTAVGHGITDYKIGDEVFGQASIFAGGTGAFAEYALADTKNIALKPREIDHYLAATLPLASVSALQALNNHLKLKDGQKILIHGGAGGIGSFAIQIAKDIGAYVATTVSGDEAIEFVEQLGADQIIDYKEKNFEDILMDFDAVFDTVGGDTYDRSFQILKKGGIIVSMIEKPKQDLIQQYGVNAEMQNTNITTDDLVKIAELVDDDIIAPYIDKTFDLNQTTQALSYLEHGHPKGKVIIKVKTE